jgi:hypothetical protein
VEDLRVDKKEKQPIKVATPNAMAGVCESMRPLGLLAGQTKESPECWHCCELTEQLFYGAEPLGVESHGVGVLEKH